MTGTVIGILSGKGGVGKTTVVSNMGAVLTKDFKRNIIILDSNVTTSHLGLHLGLYNDLPVTLKEVLSKNIPVTYAIFVHPSTGIRILPAPLSGDGVKLSKLGSIIEQLKDNYEIILVDCAPGLGKEVVSVIGDLDKAIIVATPDLPSVTDALKTIDLLKALGKEVFGIVLNRVSRDEIELTVEEVEATCKCPVIGIIPEDHRVPESISKGSPIVLMKPNSPASIELKKLAALLIGERYKPRGILSTLKRLVGIGKKAHKPKPLIIKKTKKRKKPSLALRKEVLDIEELERQISEGIEYDIKSPEREIIKKELMERVKKKLKERGV